LRQNPFQPPHSILQPILRKNRMAPAQPAFAFHAPAGYFAYQKACQFLH